MESKHDKFLRIQEARLPKAIKGIELLGNLSSSNYEWTKADAADMIRQLNDAVDDLSSEFGIQTVSKEVFMPIPLDESYARWAYDKLKAGKTKEGTELLLTALKLLTGDKK